MSELDDKIERTMAFILEQQAQHEIRWAENDKRWAEADKRWEDTVISVRGLLAIVEAHEDQLQVHETNHLRLDAKIAALIEAGERTDERLNALIAIVEGRISGEGGRLA